MKKYIAIMYDYDENNYIFRFYMKNGTVKLPLKLLDSIIIITYDIINITGSHR